MYAPVFEICAGYAPLQAILGSNPMRLWAFGEAPENETRPYATFQHTYGAPDNHVNERPKVDRFGIQIDTFGKSVSEARNIAEGIRDAIESDAYVVSWNGEFWDVPTGLYRYSFSVEFLTSR